MIIVFPRKLIYEEADGYQIAWNSVKVKEFTFLGTPSGVRIVADRNRPLLLSAPLHQVKLPRRL